MDVYLFTVDIAGDISIFLTERGARHFMNSWWRLNPHLCKEIYPKELYVKLYSNLSIML